MLSVLCLLALLVDGRSWRAAYACWVLSMAFSFLNMAIEPASLFFRPFNLEETRRSAAAQSPLCAALSTLATVCMLLAALLWLLGV